MTVLEVSIKHAGKAYDISLDTNQAPTAFKQTIYETTGVPPDRMKVMSKGIVLKVKSISSCSFQYLTIPQDDTPWEKLSLKSVSLPLLSHARPLTRSIVAGCSVHGYRR